MNLLLRNELVFSALLSLSACSLLPSRPPSPALHDFGLGGKPSASQSAPWASVTVDAPEWLQSENIRYRLLYSDPTQVRFYAQDRWIAPPPALLMQRLGLAASGKGVTLKIKLLEFEQVFDGPQQARLLLAFRALAYRTGEESPTVEKVFQFSRPTPSADAKGAVTAVEGLVDGLSQALAAWLGEL